MKRSEERVGVAQRAQWLAELAAAVEQAQRLAWSLGVAEGSNAEARLLYGHLEALRAEIGLLRRPAETFRERRRDSSSSDASRPPPVTHP